MTAKWLLVAVAAMMAGSAFAAEKESGAVTPNLDKGSRVIEGAGCIYVMGDDVLQHSLILRPTVRPH